MHPSAWRVSVRRASTWETSASRCLVGIDTRPLASNVRALRPWNNFSSPLFCTKSYFSPLYGNGYDWSRATLQFFQLQQALSGMSVDAQKKIAREIKKLGEDLKVLCQY